MKRPSLTFFDKIKFSRLSAEDLACYAYALICCQGPASVVSGEWHEKVDKVCGRKISELRDEINSRVDRGDHNEELTHALTVINGTAELVNCATSWTEEVNLIELSVTDLIRRYSMSGNWTAKRRRKKMEVFTRYYQWRIVNEILSRQDGKILAKILTLTECLEADGYAHNLNIPYNVGERPATFIPSEFPSDKVLISHIRSLSEKADYISREELIAIADYIQAEIVEKGATTDHIELVNAILNTGMPSFNYPNIAKEFEKATNILAKTNSRSMISLAPAYYTLWSLTLKQTYLSRFEKTVRHCYSALATDRAYPLLGVDKNEPGSLATAINFLKENRKTLWILNDKYDLEKIIPKYKTAVQG